MNAKKTKQLRKTLAQIAEQPPVISFHQRTLTNGVPFLHDVVNPIRYPDGSRRRMYQDLKAGRVPKNADSLFEAIAEKLAA